MLACIVYAFGAGSLYRLNANDRYQSRFLAAGIAAAILISSSNSMVSFPHPMDFKSWVPGTITFSLLLSTAVHNINPRWRTRSAEVPENTDEKYCTMEIWESVDTVDLLFGGVSIKGEKKGRTGRGAPASIFYVERQCLFLQRESFIFLRNFIRDEPFSRVSFPFFSFPFRTTSNIILRCSQQFLLDGTGSPIYTIRLTNFHHKLTLSSLISARHHPKITPTHFSLPPNIDTQLIDPGSLFRLQCEKLLDWRIKALFFLFCLGVLWEQVLYCTFLIFCMQAIFKFDTIS